MLVTHSKYQIKETNPWTDFQFFFFSKTWHFSSCSAEGFSSSTCLAGSRNDLADLR